MALLSKHGWLRTFGPMAVVYVAALALLVLPTKAPAMTFEAVPASGGCAASACIVATGEINGDSGRAFKAFIRAHHVGRGGLIALNSNGGTVVDGLALGSQIRKAGLSTTVQDYDRVRGRFSRGGICASACAYAFLGGVERTVGTGARLGVHQMYGNMQATDALSVSDAQWLTSLVALHIDRMGAALGVLTLALRTPPKDMHWLSSAELSRLDVVTTATVAVTLAGD